MSLALAQACAQLVGEVRAAWDWLTEQVQPGPTDPPSERHVSAAQAQIEDREVRRDRDSRYLPTVDRPPGVPSGAVRHLAVPPPSSVGPHPDAARVSPIHGRVIVAEQLWRAAAALHLAVYGTPIQHRAADPRVRPPGTACPVCAAARGCWCDHDDMQVAAALHVITAHLTGGLPSEEPLPGLLSALERANREARRAAGAYVTLLVLKAPCPACDGRDLVADCSSPNRDEWSIRCRNRLCVCAGPGCRCGCRVRYHGKQHRWQAGTGQWHDLAGRLGVTYRQLYQQAARPPALPSRHTGGGRRA
jgi:hypothetical protein